MQYVSGCIFLLTYHLHTIKAPFKPLRGQWVLLIRREATITTWNTKPDWKTNRQHEVRQSTKQKENKNMKECLWVRYKHQKCPVKFLLISYFRFLQHHRVPCCRVVIAGSPWKHCGYILKHLDWLRRSSPNLIRLCESVWVDMCVIGVSIRH